MDNFINLAKQGYQAYETSQEGQQGGQAQSGRHQSQSGQGQGGQGGYGQSGQGGQGGYGGGQGGQEDYDQGNQGQGGYGQSNQGGYGQSNQGGYGQSNQGGHGQSNQGGYGQSNQGGYGQSNQSGYGGNQEEGQYGHNRPSSGYDSQSGPDIDHQAAVSNATQHAGGSGDSSMFNNALGYLNQNQSQHTQPIDEQQVQNAHAEAYEKGNASSLDANSLGSAAAMQVLKSFTSGGGSSGGNGNTQTQLISMAMSEASKLFDSQGSASGQKQDAINGAVMTVMKMVVQSKMGGAPTTGGGSSGGLGSLMGLASQFLK